MHSTSILLNRQTIIYIEFRCTNQISITTNNEGKFTVLIQLYGVLKKEFYNLKNQITNKLDTQFNLESNL